LRSVVAEDFAVASLISEHLFEIAVDLLHQRRKGGHIVRLLGIMTMAIGRPSALVGGVDFG
jgi:hypothetical protein